VEPREELLAVKEEPPGRFGMLNMADASGFRLVTAILKISFFEITGSMASACFLITESCRLSKYFTFCTVPQENKTGKKKKTKTKRYDGVEFISCFTLLIDTN
jgi:hypothetical protein